MGERWAAALLSWGWRGALLMSEISTARYFMGASVARRRRGRSCGILVVAVALRLGRLDRWWRRELRASGTPSLGAAASVRSVPARLTFGYRLRAARARDRAAPRSAGTVGEPLRCGMPGVPAAVPALVPGDRSLRRPVAPRLREPLDEALRGTGDRGAVHCSGSGPATNGFRFGPSPPWAPSSSSRQ